MNWSVSEGTGKVTIYISGEVSEIKMLFIPNREYYKCMDICDWFRNNVYLDIRMSARSATCGQLSIPPMASLLPHIE